MRIGDERWLVAPYGERNLGEERAAAGWVELRRGVGASASAWTSSARGSRARAPGVLPPGRVTRPFFDVSLDSSREEWLAEAPRHPVFLLGGRSRRIDCVGEILLVAATDIELCEHPGLVCGVGPVEAAAATARRLALDGPRRYCTSG